MELKKDNKLSLKIIIISSILIILLVSLQNTFTGKVVSETGITNPDSTTQKRDLSKYTQSYCEEGQTMPCGIAPEEGECKRGIQECVNGNWRECKDEIYPSRELCDSGKDEDCDGTIDEQDCYRLENRKSSLWERLLRVFGISGHSINTAKFFIQMTN